MRPHSLRNHLIDRHRLYLRGKQLTRMHEVINTVHQIKIIQGIYLTDVAFTELTDEAQSAIIDESIPYYKLCHQKKR